MSDRMDAVLTSIDQALDGCDDDWAVSGDAMRWAPPGQEASEPPCACTMSTLCDYHGHEHRALTSRMFDMVNLNCTCGHLAVSFLGDVNDEAIEAKFAEHLDEARAPADEDESLDHTMPTQSWAVTVPVTCTYVNHEAMNDLFDEDDPRNTIRDNLNQMQDEAWRAALEHLQADTGASANGEPDEGQEVFIGFDVVGDTVTYAMVSGDCIWRTGSFPAPEGIDEEWRDHMGQIVVKGTWTSQPTTDPRSTP
ncbi:hypothetical protein [Glycomyces tenuis]|uniref:hypothetical protein n=1 Tax=Glycomyces tenuis TaxID=58116 RepID=UPI0004072014|nr:hypothetical protein [Glycomyces tenuis]